MLLFEEEKLKRAKELMDLAQKLYIQGDLVAEKTTGICCKEALQLLETCENNLPKWIHICSANIWLFLSFLKDLRLMHVELDPLNSSADLFDPTVVRTSFVPKPLEKLCSASFRHGFNRLRTTFEEAIRVWRQYLMPSMSIGATGEQKPIDAKIRVEIKEVSINLAQISLLTHNPICALEVYYYVWHWTKTATALRFLTTLLIGFGFPKTASTMTESVTDNEKTHDGYGTWFYLKQVKRLAKLVKDNANDDGRVDNDETLEEWTYNGFPVTQTVYRRLESVTLFVDSFALQKPNPSGLLEKKSAAVAITRARKQYYFNKMETCPTLDLQIGQQNAIDTFWYLQMLLNDALMQQRIGRARWAELLLMEGFSTAFVLCSPYWLLKFANHLAQFRSLCELSETDCLERLVFVQKIFSSDEPKPTAEVTKVIEVPKSVPTSSNDGKQLPGRKRIVSDSAEIELSRHADNSTSEQTILKSDHVLLSKIAGASKKMRERSSVSLSLTPNSIRCARHDDLTSVNESIFQAIVASCTISTDAKLWKKKCLEMLRAQIIRSKFVAGSSCCGSTTWDDFKLDDEEFQAFVNESLWNLLDFYLLKQSTIGSNATEIKILEKAIDLLPSTNVGLFSLYYRLSFSQSMTSWKLAQRSDVVDRMAKLRLTEVTDQVQKQKRGKAKTTSQQSVDDENKAMAGQISENIRRYGHLKFFPWYRSARETMGFLYLSDTRSNNRSALAATNFLETSAINFRHALELSNEQEIAARLCQFEDDKSLTDALTNLPVGWTVVSLCLDQTTSHRRLILCRLSSRCRPIVVDLGDAIGQFNAIEEFGLCVQDVEKSRKITDKKLFWNTLHALEYKMGDLLERLERDWFGHRRGLLRGYSEEQQKKCSKRSASVDEFTFEVLLTAAGALNNREKDRYLSEMVPLRGGKSTKYHDLLDELESDATDVGPVFLILDKELHGIPWENVPSLRRKPVSRTPCLQFLLQSISTLKPPRTVSSDRVFYVVNPSRDLLITEEYFKWFKSFKTWAGHFSRQPSFATMKEELASNDVHLYCGHNIGVDCLQSYSTVEQLTCKAAVILMGCRSCKMKSRGPIFEPDGLHLSYLLAKSPAVVGCLWNITAPDIDRYLEEVLRLWLNVTPPNKKSKDDKIFKCASLLNAIAEASSVCKLPLLTGAAVISLGLPIVCNKTFL